MFNGSPEFNLYIWNGLPNESQPFRAKEILNPLMPCQ